MFRVADIYDEASAIIGVGDDAKLFRWLGDAVSLISNKSDLEGWKGYLDICSSGCSCSPTSAACNNPGGCGRTCVTLPREVETVLAVNIGGQPTLGYGQLFEFHLNGPGSCRQTCAWSWQDLGNFHCTYRDLRSPAKLVSYLSSDEDNGAELVVFGYDEKGQPLRRSEGGKWLKGYRVPTIYGVALPDADAPLVARITGIFKAVTAGPLRLSTLDDSGASGVLLTVLEPDETLPQYRRIKLGRPCNWVRIAYRKATPSFSSKYDHVPLKSRVAFLMAVQARKMYHDLQVDSAHSFESDAVRLETEAQQMSEAPTYSPIQVIDLNGPRDKDDFDIR